MSFTPAQKLAIVTGGSTGIGAATCAALAVDGWDVGLTYAHDAEEAAATAETVRSYGRRAFTAQMDLEDLPAAPAAIDRLVEQLGGLHGFVNNAGTVVLDTFLSASWEDWRKQLDVNLGGAFLCLQKAATAILDTGGGIYGGPKGDGTDGGGNGVPFRGGIGSIVIVSSVHQTEPNPLSPLYDVTKHGLNALMKGMALDLGPKGVRVNCVAPGEIATPLNGMSGEDVEAMTSATDRPAYACGRVGHPDEIAQAIAFLLSEKSSFMTGSSVTVDGGFEIMTPYAAGIYKPTKPHSGAHGESLTSKVAEVVERAVGGE